MTILGDDINIEIESCFKKGHISVPIIEVLKVPSLRERAKRVSRWSETSEVPFEDPP